MATRTVYTSTIRVPVYGSWRCAHCGEVNFSTGNIVCQCQAATTSFRNSKQEETKREATNLTQEKWAENAYKIITDPNNNAQNVRNSLFLENTICTQCGKKPQWDKDMKYMTWLSLSFVPALISGFVAIGMGSNVVAWLVFIAFLAVVVISCTSESRYKKMMKMLPKEYTPVLGSLNVELIKYAKHLGKTIPNPDETIEIVKGYDKNANLTLESSKTSVENITLPDSNNFVQNNFCRKCGAPLQSDGDFCNKCGTKIIKS